MKDEYEQINFLNNNEMSFTDKVLKEAVKKIQDDNLKLESIFWGTHKVNKIMVKFSFIEWLKYINIKSQIEDTTKPNEQRRIQFYLDNYGKTYISS